jgi:hypothetical protein
MPDPILLVAGSKGSCSCASAHRRFREWAEAGVFLEFWRRGLLAYDDMFGIEWEWLAMDGALGKAPLGASRPARIPLTVLKGGETIAPHRGRPARDRAGACEPERLQALPQYSHPRSVSAGLRFGYSSCCGDLRDHRRLAVISPLWRHFGRR